MVAAAESGIGGFILQINDFDAYIYTISTVDNNACVVPLGNSEFNFSCSPANSPGTYIISQNIFGIEFEFASIVTEGEISVNDEIWQIEDAIFLNISNTFEFDGLENFVDTASNYYAGDSGYIAMMNSNYYENIFGNLLPVPIYPEAFLDLNI